MSRAGEPVKMRGDKQFPAPCHCAAGRASFRGMSTLAEIEAAIEKLPPEQWMEIRRWMDHHSPETTAGGAGRADAAETPDFLARQKARFGDKVLRDSQAVLDEVRADRF